MINILVTDDDSVDRLLVRQALASSTIPMRVCEACTATDCLRILQERPVDCLLLDYRLPDMDGIDVLRQLAKSADGCPTAVVMLTGSGNEKVAVDAMKLGIQDYLVKGEFTPEELEDAVRAALETHDQRKAEVLARHKLRELALTDPVTGLGNRNLLHERLDHALKLADRNRTAVGLMLLDLNGFKQVNDTHGHLVGDVVLKEVARRLKAATRDADTVARLGGDEFVVILETGASHQGIEALEDRIRTALDRPIDLEGVTLQVGASIGVACYPGDAADRIGLLGAADAAMYRQKHDVKRGDPDS